MMEHVAIRLLGLEPECYAQAQAKEKSYINWVLFSFAIVLIICLISMFIIGLFVSGGIWPACFIAILGTFVFISIFRFSLILIKPNLSIVKQFNEVILKTTLNQKWLRFISQLKDVKRNIKKIRFKRDSEIPGFTLFFRIMYMGLFAFVLIFPLVTLSGWTDALQFNHSIREKALVKYQESLNDSNALLNLNNEISLSEKLDWYEEKVNNEYFTMQIFSHVCSYSSFNFIAFLVCFVLFLPHLLLFLLMRNKDFVYVNAVNNYFKKRIELNYLELNQEARLLLKKYEALNHPVNLDFLQKGNPYLQQAEGQQRENISWNDHIKLKASNLKAQ